MQASRLLSILMLMQSHERMTAATLARMLEVSERTILRDIDQLSAAGVPLWSERGRQGGFRLRPGWSTQLTGMTESESQALLLAGLPGPATELGLGEAAVSARLKMVASLPSSLREQAAQVADRLHIDPVDWYRTPDAPAFLREVADAVWNARRLRVRYASWRKTAWRELEPLGLVLKGGGWYVVARSVPVAPVDADEEPGGRQPKRSRRHRGAALDTTSEPRTYRLASVLAVEAGRGGFRRPRDFDLARFWAASAARFEAELSPLQALVRVSPLAMEWLLNARSRFVTSPLDPADGSERPGWTRGVLALESEEQGARRILGFGGEVEVLAPAPLRARVAALATLAGQLHSG